MTDPHVDGNPYLVAPVARVFVRTAAPIILVMTVNGLFTVVDALFLGHYAGAKALTAVTLMFPLMMLMIALQTMVASGMASIVARQLGARDLRAAEGTVFAAHLLAVAVCAVLILGLALTGGTMARALSGDDPEIARLGIVFLSIMVVFAPFSFFLGIQADTLRSEGHVGAMALLAVVATVLNILFNYLLIGVFDYGVAGSAAGTILAQALAMAGVVGLRLSGHTRLPLFARGSGAILADWRAILALGAPQSLGFLGISLTTGLVIVEVQLWSPSGYADTVAAYGIINRILTFAYLPLLGMSMACQSIAGNNAGAGRFDRSGAVLRIGVGCALVYAAAFETAFLLWPAAIGGLFVDAPRVVGEIARIMPVICATYAVAMPMMVVGGYFQALGMAGNAAVLSLARTYAIGLPLLSTMPSLLGERGIWLSTPIGDVLMLAVAAALLGWNARRHDLRWGLFRRPVAA
ncbi:MATE family efflux transporter [Siculibacillus lacustris]|nr:MATE family efflux transporter [Siculibacillus lacustris]